MSPNHIILLGFGGIHGPKPYKFIGLRLVLRNIGCEFDFGLSSGVDQGHPLSGRYCRPGRAALGCEAHRLDQLIAAFGWRRAFRPSCMQGRF